MRIPKNLRIPKKFPTNEKEKINPEYPYALTKYLGEQIVMHWGKVYNIEVVSLRFFNVYGLKSRTSGTYGAVFGVFLAQKFSSKPFTVVGDGRQTRDFTYVSDVVSSIISASSSDIKNEINLNFYTYIDKKVILAMLKIFIQCLKFLKQSLNLL